MVVAIALLQAWLARRQALDEGAQERTLTTMLFGFDLLIDSIALQLAVASPALSLLVSAAAVAWLLVWSWPRLRRTRFTTSYVIRRSPEAVFAFIADLRNLTQWWSEYDWVELLTAGPIGRGSRFRAQTRMPPHGKKKYVADAEILDFEPNRRMTARVSSSIHPNCAEYLFEPTDTSTRLTYRFDYEHSFTSAALGARLLQKLTTDGLLRAAHDRAQTRIRQILEI